MKFREIVFQYGKKLNWQRYIVQRGDFYGGGKKLCII
jgi:hypothetical protein